MRDVTLETQLRLLTLQVESWKKLHDFITYALDRAKPIISADQERQFTDIRGTLLQETEHVLTELNLVDASDSEARVFREAAAFGLELARFAPAEWETFFPGFLPTDEPFRTAARVADADAVFDGALVARYGPAKAASA